MAGKSINRPINSSESQQSSGLGIERLVMSFNQSGEIIEIHEADGNYCPIRLIAGFAGEATGGRIDSQVAGTKSAKEAAGLGRTDDRVLAVLFSLSISFR